MKHKARTTTKPNENRMRCCFCTYGQFLAFLIAVLVLDGRTTKMRGGEIKETKTTGDCRRRLRLPFVIK